MWHFPLLGMHPELRWDKTKSLAGDWHRHPIPVIILGAAVPCREHYQCNEVISQKYWSTPKSNPPGKVSAVRVTAADFIFPGEGRWETMASVVLRPNESQDSLLKRFRKKVVKSGVLSTIRRKRWFVSKSELRRADKKKAIRRIKRRQYTKVGE